VNYDQVDMVQICLKPSLCGIPDEIFKLVVYNSVTVSLCAVRELLAAYSLTP